MYQLRKIKSGAVSFLAIVILISFWVPNVSLALEIRVYDQAIVNSEKVYLKDIASFQPKIKDKTDHFGNIEIANAPPPGRNYQLSNQFLNYKITTAIKQKNIHNEKIKLKIPISLEIKRIAQYIKRDEFENIFKDYLLNNSNFAHQELIFDNIRTPASIVLPEGVLRYDVRGNVNRNNGGNINLVIDLIVDEKLVRKVKISGRVGIIGDVISAVKKIKRGQIVEKEDFEVAQETIWNSNLTMIDQDSIIGKRALRNIRAGYNITPQMVEDPPLVKKGKRVVIKAHNKSISVSTLGKVLEDGREGDQIRVININSGKEIMATVEGPGLVMVKF